MKTNRLFLTAATLSILGFGLMLPSRAQDTSSSADKDQPSSSDGSKAQDQHSVTSHPKKISEEEMKKKVTNVNKASKFIGMNVKNLQNESLGKVDDLAIDPESGKIAYAVLSVGGFLGLNDKYIAVPINALIPAPGADHLVLDADKQRLDRAPGFAKNRWPDLDTPAWAAAAGFSRTPRSTPAAGGTGQSAQQQGTASQTSSQPPPSSSSPDQRDQTDSSSSDKSDQQHYSGKVSSVDPSARSLTVTGDEGDKTFKLESNSQITVGSQNDAKLDDLKTGSKVSVEYSKEGDKSVAKSVQAKEDSDSNPDEKK